MMMDVDGLPHGFQPSNVVQDFFQAQYYALFSFHLVDSWWNSPIMSISSSLLLQFLCCLDTLTCSSSTHTHIYIYVIHTWIYIYIYITRTHITHVLYVFIYIIIYIYTCGNWKLMGFPTVQRKWSLKCLVSRLLEGLQATVPIVAPACQTAFCCSASLSNRSCGRFSSVKYVENL